MLYVSLQILVDIPIAVLIWLFSGSIYFPLHNKSWSFCDVSLCLGFNHISHEKWNLGTPRSVSLLFLQPIPILSDIPFFENFLFLNYFQDKNYQTILIHDRAKISPWTYISWLFKMALCITYASAHFLIFLWFSFRQLFKHKQKLCFFEWQSSLQTFRGYINFICQVVWITAGIFR